MNSTLEKRLMILENSKNPSYERIAEALPSIDQTIAEACGGEKPPTINPAGPRFLVLAMLRLTEYMRVLSGLKWATYQDFQDSKNSPFTEGV